MMNAIDSGARRQPGCLSDLALDRFRFGELEGTAEGAQAGAHLRACAACGARMAEMQAVVAPPIDLAASPSPVRHQPRWRLRALWLAPVFAAAALALLVPLRRPDPNRTKGSAWQLGVVARYPSGRVAAVSPGGALAPGDRVRFEVSAPKDGFVSVISADTSGAVTAFAPTAGEAVAVRSGRRLLDGAIRLDDSLGDERLLLVACERPLPVSEVVSAGRSSLDRAGGRLDLMPPLDLPCAQSSFWIRKEIRR